MGRASGTAAPRREPAWPVEGGRRVHRSELGLAGGVDNMAAFRVLDFEFGEGKESARVHDAPTRKQVSCLGPGRAEIVDEERARHNGDTGRCRRQRHTRQGRLDEGRDLEGAGRALEPRAGGHCPGSRSRADVGGAYPVKTRERRRGQQALAECANPVDPGECPEPGRRDGASNGLAVNHERIVSDRILSGHTRRQRTIWLSV